MLRTKGLLGKIKRGSFGSTLALLFALSAWQYYDQGRITWHYALLDQFQQSAGGLVDGTPANEPTSPQSTTPGQTLAGRVVEVKDGDTFILRNPDNTRYTIRLHGIDTPEWNQPYGKSSASALARMINGREVTVKTEAMDDYGRVVGRVYHDEQDVNLAMVRDGHAWWYKQYAKSDRALNDAETAARKEQAGLWADADPTPPWIWRHRH